MSNKITKEIGQLLDYLEEKFYYICGSLPYSKLNNTFGGDPHVILLASESMSKSYDEMYYFMHKNEANPIRYIFVGDIMIDAYKKIRKTIKKGEKEVNFTSKDLGETCLHEFFKLKKIQESTPRKSSLISLVNLNFDYNTINLK